MGIITDITHPKHPLIRALTNKGYKDFTLIYTPTYGTQCGWNLDGVLLPTWLGYTKKSALEEIEKLQTFQQIHKQRKQLGKKSTKKKLEEYIIAICIVPIGYQIDLLDHKEYINGNVKEIHSECRDYGTSVNVEKASEMILDLVRNMEQKIKKLK